MYGNMASQTPVFVPEVSTLTLHFFPHPAVLTPSQLQNLKSPTQVFVSLNPHGPPDSALVHKTIKYRHPQFSPRAEKGQRLLSSIDGKRGLWFAGAWRGYGFHEVRVLRGVILGLGSSRDGFD